MSSNDDLKTPLLADDPVLPDDKVKKEKKKKKKTATTTNKENGNTATPVPLPPLPKMVIKIKSMQDAATAQLEQRAEANKQYAANALPEYFKWWNIAFLSPSDKMQLVIALAQHCPDVLPDANRRLLIQRIFCPDHPTHVVVKYKVPPQIGGNMGGSIRRTILTRQELAALHMLKPVIEVGNFDQALIDGSRATASITFASLELNEVREFYQVQHMLMYFSRPDNAERRKRGFLYGIAQQAIHMLQTNGWKEVHEIRPHTTDMYANVLLETTTEEMMKTTSLWSVLGVKDPPLEVQIKVAGLDKTPQEEPSDDEHDIEFDIPDIKEDAGIV